MHLPQKTLSLNIVGAKLVSCPGAI